MNETAKLSNKLIEHSSDAVGEIPDKVFKSRMPATFHQPVRATQPLLIVESIVYLLEHDKFIRTRMMSFIVRR